MINIEELEKIDKYFEIKYKGSFVSDGITNIDKYLKARKKILWILKEPNDGKDVKSWDQREFHQNIKKYPNWKRTYKLIVKCSWGILNEIESYNKTEKEDNITDVMHEIAFINLKKTSGGSNSSYSEIEKYYIEDKENILDQIKNINPEVIINCTRLEDVSKDLLADDNFMKNECFYVGKKDNTIVIHAFHPNNRKIKHEKYYDLIMKSLLKC